MQQKILFNEAVQNYKVLGFFSVMRFIKRVSNGAASHKWLQASFGFVGLVQ